MNKSMGRTAAFWIYGQKSPKSVEILVFPKGKLHQCEIVFKNLRAYLAEI